MSGTSDSSSLREKLRSEVLPCRWSDLRQHQRRGGLLLVRPDLDLLEVGVAMATDRADRVEVWLLTGRLVRPDDALASTFEERDPRFQFIIVQPWVLAQELLEAEPG